LKAPSLAVPKSLGEEAIRLLSKMALVNRSLRVASNGRLHIPLNRLPSDEEWQVLGDRLPEARLSERDFSLRKRRPRSLLEALGDKLQPHLLAALPRSMDLIGSVAIVEIPPELEASKRLVGEAVLQIYKKVRIVLAKAGPVAGETRLRDYEVIAGSGDTETTYREFGCLYVLDPTKVYFSPRLSQERMRVAQSVRSGEAVLDMFAGVGPFSILIAKTKRNVTVYAVDINPEAINYLRRNIALNKVEDHVTPLLGDVREIVAMSLVGKAGRVIMNLPESAAEFVSTACQALGPDGGVIHYYTFQRGMNTVEQAEEEFREKVDEAGRGVEAIEASRLVRETAPRMWQVVIDAMVR